MLTNKMIQKNTLPENATHVVTLDTDHKIVSLSMLVNQKVFKDGSNRMDQETENNQLTEDHYLARLEGTEVLHRTKEIKDIKDTSKTTKDTIRALRHTLVIEAEAVTMIETNILTEEVAMNQIQGNPFEIFTIKAWQTLLLLFKPNSKKRYQLPKIVSEDLQSGSYSKGKKKKKKKKKTEETSCQEKYS